MNPLSSIKPNFFIIGAPKSGTSALSVYLSSHPAVHFSQPKEPKYFHTDFREAHRDRLSWEDYLRCFDPEQLRRCQAVGEATVWYLYSRVAVPNILDFNPSAKFIVMVRNPVDLAYSLHSQLLYGGHENVESFEAAWRLQSDRRLGREVPPGCPDARVLQYGEVAMLGEQLERVYGIVSKDRVEVFFQEDLSREPLAVYHESLEFLGLAPDGRSSFPLINRSRRVRYLALARLFFYGRVIKRRLGFRRSFGLWRRVSPLVSSPAERRPLKADFRRELQRFFAKDLRKLSRLVGRDLSHWSR